MSKVHPPLLPFMVGGVPEAGCDEAGRGCLAGPVYAAAVILPPDFSSPLLNDSKQLSDRQRRLLRPVIESQALAWAVASCSAKEVDSLNILNASILAMHRALDGLSVRPGNIIVDGNRFKPYHDVPCKTVVGGDARYLSIAAASVLAKTYRDDYMIALDAEFPQYGWRRNMGYPTREHRAAIAKDGPSPHHRMSFTLLPRNNTFNFCGWIYLNGSGPSGRGGDESGG